MKKCPFCAEDIQDTAIVCRYCGRYLVPPAVPASAPQPNPGVEKAKQFAIGCLVTVVIFLVIAGIVSLSGDKDDKRVDVSRCRPASQEQIEAIRLGVKDVQASNDIEHAYAVTSKDFQRVQMVAASITGAGLEPGEIIAVWAISGDDHNPSGVFSAEAGSKNFSSWGPGDRTDAEINQSSDGVEIVKKCVENSY